MRSRMAGMLAQRCLARLTSALSTPLASPLVARTALAPSSLWAQFVRFRKVNIKGSVKKRFRLTATGKIKRGSTGRSHNTGKHRPRTMRTRADQHFVSSADKRRIEKMLLG